MDDIEEIKGAYKILLLGVIVLLVRGASPGRPIYWEIVDANKTDNSLFAFNWHLQKFAAKRGEYAWGSRRNRNLPSGKTSGGYSF